MQAVFLTQANLQLSQRILLPSCINLSFSSDGIVYKVQLSVLFNFLLLKISLVILGRQLFKPAYMEGCLLNVVTSLFKCESKMQHPESFQARIHLNYFPVKPCIAWPEFSVHKVKVTAANSRLFIGCKELEQETRSK